MGKAKTTGQVVTIGASGVGPAPVSAPPVAIVPRKAKQASNAHVVPGRQGFVSLFTPAIADAIVEEVRKGMPIPFAANKVRVSRQTVSRWVEEGDEIAETDPDDPKAVFSADVLQAQAEFVEERIAQIIKAADDAKQWTAAMTMLERLYPEYFHRPSESNVTVNIGIVEKTIHELQSKGELSYGGG